MGLGEVQLMDVQRCQPPKPSGGMQTRLRSPNLIRQVCDNFPNWLEPASSAGDGDGVKLGAIGHQGLDTEPCSAL